MIIFDTETTSLTAPEAAPLEQQPSIIEFAAVRVDPRTLEIKSSLEFFINPRFPLSEETTRITGITNEMVISAPPFAGRYKEIGEFFGGQQAALAHNFTFDRDCLYYELKRIGKVTAFPWPMTQICTVERTMALKGYRLNLGALYEELTGKQRKDAHRAMADVLTLHECVVEMRKRDMI